MEPTEVALAAACWLDLGAHRLVSPAVSSVRGCCGTGWVARGHLGVFSGTRASGGSSSSCWHRAGATGGARDGSPRASRTLRIDDGDVIAAMMEPCGLLHVPVARRNAGQEFGPLDAMASGGRVARGLAVVIDRLARGQL